MVRFASLLVVLVFANATLAGAQDPTPQPARPNTSVQPTPAPQPGKEQMPVRKNVATNVQIEITISDQIGAGAPEKKVVSMTVAEGTFGRVRASADAQPASPVGPAGMVMVGTELNVDARPFLHDGDRIRLELTVEYAPFREGGKVTQRPTKLNESMTVWLQNGKPMVLSQAADPVIDRKMVLEVRATIAK